MNRLGSIGRRSGSAVRGVAVAVWLAGTAHAQVAVQLQIQLGEAGGRDRVGAVGGAAAADAAIGDPWWDEAARGQRPLDGGAKPAQADPPVPARRDPQARLEGVRRSRGLQVLRRELSLVRAACPTLEPDQRGRILAVGREVVEAQAAGRTPLVNGLEKPLEQALREEAGGEAALAYRAERDARLARRQEAVIAFLVDAIDRDALLDAAGRDAVAEALRIQWRPEWESVAATAARQRFGEVRLLPGMADAIAAAIDDEAFEAWRQRMQEGGR